MQEYARRWSGIMLTRIYEDFRHAFRLILGNRALSLMLKVQAAVGRVFPAEEESVVIISHSFWQREFGGDTDVLGKTLAVNRMPLKVIGVLPQGFTGMDPMIHPQFNRVECLRCD
jgi:hypothetical protein